ncbi:hypothetical protein CRYUN_Cryun13aG0103000 [Craigia yunnanensis]
MANLRSPRYHFFCAFQFLLLVQTKVLSNQYKIGDLDAWGIPTSANPQVYAKWSKYHSFKIGDSLLFLYPPSQDSVILVTEQSYNSCNLKDPILYMNNGNSLFNITKPGEFFFTSGENLVTVKSNRSYTFLCFQGMALHMLPLMVRVHCLTLHLHPLTPLSSAQSPNRLLLRPRLDSQSSLRLLLHQPHGQ